MAYFRSSKSSVTQMIASTPKRSASNSVSDRDPQIQKLMEDVRKTEQILKDINDIAPKLNKAQQNVHKYMNQFSEQLTSMKNICIHIC